PPDSVANPPAIAANDARPAASHPAPPPAPPGFRRRAPALPADRAHIDEPRSLASPAARTSARSARSPVFPAFPITANALSVYFSMPFPERRPFVLAAACSSRSFAADSPSVLSPTRRLDVRRVARWRRVTLVYSDGEPRRTGRYRRRCVGSDGPAAARPHDRLLRGCPAPAVRRGSCKTWSSWLS